MSGKTTFLIALAVAGASMAVAETPRVPNGTTARNVTRTPVALQVGGRITWKGAKAGAGDNCTSFKVSAYEATPGSASGGGISIASGKDLGLSGHASGNILQGACSYGISGLPTGKDVYVSVHYAGPMGDATSASSHFTAKASGNGAQDVVVNFVTLH
jgi:hypothetical protein